MADHFLTGRDQTLYWKGRKVADLRGIDERREAVVIAVEVSWSRASALATWSGTRS